MATEIGDLIGGRYKIIAQVGEGGMSKVYLAMDLHVTDKRWAVKEIKKTKNLAMNDIVSNSLMAEVNLLKGLDHPALPRIVDVLDMGDSMFFIMDYIEGWSLDKVLERNGPCGELEVIEWARQLCDALRYLHNQKPPIIYRDMKPANIMLKADGNVKIIDFGIAREYKESKLLDTTVLGTKGFAPPEQYGSRQTDGRSDIYSLGMTMHNLLTNIDPRSKGYQYRPVSRFRPDIHPGLDGLINRCLALDPEDRYQNCDELMYALNNYQIEDEHYWEKQKKKLYIFMAIVAFSLLMVITGICGIIFKNNENDRDYLQKINISTSADYESRIDSYLQAIDLYASDPRAYLKLLETFTENQCFGEKESSIFINKFNKNKDKLDPEDDPCLNLYYQAGLTYLYLYSGGDNSFRNRILKAYSYFAAITESKRTDYDYYGIAESYQLLGDFYSRYVVNATSVKEPDGEDYRSLLESLKLCLERVNSYKGDDASYISLVMYQEIMNLLNDHRKGLALNDINLQDIIKLYDEIDYQTKALSVTRIKSLELRDFILDNLDIYKANAERVYGNMEERKINGGDI